MSGTSIVSRWHLVSFRVPIVCLFCHILHISSTVISATVWAEVAKFVDDSHASQGSAEGMLCLWVVSLDGSNLDRSKMDGWMQTMMDENEDVIGHREPCCIY